jgi:RsiW-degrading membrane proteinase PrsW (M82 family)
MILLFSIYIFFGILPSFIWLFYYLKKDLHPESKKMVLKIFLWGTLSALPVYFTQVALKNLFASFALPLLFANIIYWFLVIAFTEEIFKYLVVKFGALNSPSLDEPVDIMIYMIVSALGFAAIENIFYIISSAINMSLDQTITIAVFISITRFIGATLLHTLCSASLGYFIALSFFKTKDRLILFIFGLTLAVVLHGFYNFSIIRIKGPLIIELSIAFMVAFNALLSAFVFPKFKKLRKMKSICNL